MVRKKKRKRKKDISPDNAIIEEYTEYADILGEIVLSPFEPPVEFKEIKYLGTTSTFIIRGPVTGQRYTFTTKERVRAVAIEDYGELLQRVRAARKCCGSKRMIPEQPYFGPV